MADNHNQQNHSENPGPLVSWLLPIGVIVIVLGLLVYFV